VITTSRVEENKEGTRLGSETESVGTIQAQERGKEGRVPGYRGVYEYRRALVTDMREVSYQLRIVNSLLPASTAGDNDGNS